MKIEKKNLFYSMLWMIIIISGCSESSKFPLESNGAAPEVTAFAEEKYNDLFTRYGNGWT